jgi:hypothetical protein
MSFGIAELLIYVVPILAGIIGSRHLSRLANFCLMIAVFQIDIAILRLVAFGGDFRLQLLLPYTVIGIIPAVAGILGGRYLGNIGNACLVIAVFYIGSVLLAFYGTGEFRPVSFLGGVFVSPGDLVPPLVFILVARLAYRHEQERVRP